MSTTPTKHYVDNAKLLGELKVYREQYLKSKELEQEPPQVPGYVGECLLKIATHLSYKNNFINYTYREEMIMDGVENCLQYINNFDPSKSSNPFAYFTQIVYYAFLRRISKEKKHSYIKNKMIQNVGLDAFELQDHDEDGEFTNAYIDYLRMHADFEDPFEKKKQKKQQTKVVDSSLENFMEGDADESSSDH